MRITDQKDFISNICDAILNDYDVLKAAKAEGVDISLVNPNGRMTFSLLEFDYTSTKTKEEEINMLRSNIIGHDILQESIKSAWWKDR